MFVVKIQNQFSDTAPDPVLFYAGEFGYCFSNFSAFNVRWRDRVWQTSEHAYQAASYDEEQIIEEIAAAPSAHEALMLAIKYQDQQRPHWDAEKVSVMKEICRAKLQQHEYVQQSLKKSGNSELVEDSPKDDFWGRGPEGNGANHLGKIWMELREKMRG